MQICIDEKALQKKIILKNLYSKGKLITKGFFFFSRLINKGLSHLTIIKENFTMKTLFSSP